MKDDVVYGHDDIVRCYLIVEVCGRGRFSIEGYDSSDTMAREIDDGEYNNWQDEQKRSDGSEDVMYEQLKT